MEHIKNFIIVFLMILSIYQTNKIWNLTNALFNPISSVKSINVESEYRKAFAMPYKMYKYSNYSGNYSTMVCEEMASLEQYLKNIIKEGTFINTRYITNLEAKKTDVALEYSYEVTYRDFVHTLEGNSESINNDFDFDIIYTYNNDDGTQVVNFVNSNTNVLNRFEITKDKALKEDFLIEKENSYEYAMSIVNYQTTTNFFVPVVIGNNVIYNKVYRKNPYLSENDLLLANVQEKLKDLFGTSNNIWSRTDEDRFIFSNDDVIIKYYADDVVEASYYNVDNKTELSVDEAFAISYGFIKDDKFVSNDVYLSSYSYENEKYIFNFNYVLDNYYIDYKNSEDMTSHIKVTVENGNVTNYKKYVYNYDKISNYRKSINIGFNEVLETANIDSKNIKDVNLTFLDNGSDIELYWKVNQWDNEKTYYSVE